MIPNNPNALNVYDSLIPQLIPRVPWDIWFLPQLKSKSKHHWFDSVIIYQERKKRGKRVACGKLGRRCAFWPSENILLVIKTGTRILILRELPGFQRRCSRFSTAHSEALVRVVWTRRWPFSWAVSFSTPSTRGSSTRSSGWEPMWVIISSHTDLLSDHIDWSCLIFDLLIITYWSVEWSYRLVIFDLWSSNHHILIGWVIILIGHFWSLMFLSVRTDQGLRCRKLQ